MQYRALFLAWFPACSGRNPDSVSVMYLIEMSLQIYLLSQLPMRMQTCRSLVSLNLDSPTPMYLPRKGRATPSCMTYIHDAILQGTANNRSRTLQPCVASQARASNDNRNHRRDGRSGMRETRGPEPQSTILYSQDVHVLQKTMAVFVSRMCGLTIACCEP
ncbi:hypothetical protein F5Y05DRAFT_48898 [Hypoxylon sp. FL0543]|nr:hypothetical protein F5Y05DRAFT_48898 [Hypoxylon sp. FL0543]